MHTYTAREKSTLHINVSSTSVNLALASSVGPYLLTESYKGGGVGGRTSVEADFVCAPVGEFSELALELGRQVVAPDERT